MKAAEGQSAEGNQLLHWRRGVWQGGAKLETAEVAEDPEFRDPDSYLAQVILPDLAAA